VVDEVGGVSPVELGYVAVDEVGLVECTDVLVVSAGGRKGGVEEEVDPVVRDVYGVVVSEGWYGSAEDVEVSGVPLVLGGGLTGVEQGGYVGQV